MIAQIFEDVFSSNYSLFYYLNITQDMQIHLLKVDININQVKLNIRFPGQLSFQVKNPHLYQDIQKMFPLINGECKVDQMISFESEATYDSVKQKYTEVAVDLVISINTNSGKIVAGIANFNAAENKKNGIFTIKRCSDKQAVLQMSVYFANIKKLKDVEMQINLQKAPLKNSNKIATSPIHDISSPSLNINLSQVNNSKIEGQKERDYSKSSEKLRQLLNSRGKNTGLNQRYKQIQANNNYRLKIVSREKQEIESQLQQTKQRYKNTQRREKQLQITIKQLKDANQKKRIRIVDLQSKQAQYEKLTMQNQKRIRQLHQELKVAKENIEQALSRNSLLQKRLQTREQAANEKQKRYTQKIGYLQAQHTKITHQCNILLQKMEYQQKNHQNIVKTKERTFLQEKLRLKEQLDNLEKKYKFLTEQNSDFLAKNTVISEIQKKLQIRISQLQNQLQNNSSSLLALMNQLDRQRKIRVELQKQILNFKELESEKSSLKKKLAQQNQENQKTKDKLDKLTLQYQELKENHNHQEIALDQHRKDKKNLQNKFTQLEKQYNILEKQVARLQLQNNGLSCKNTLLNERTNDIKSKLQHLEREFSEKQTNYLNKLKSIGQSKQYIIVQVQDLKWTLQKQKENVCQAEKKLKQKNEKILQQEEMIVNLQNQVAQAKVKYEEFQIVITNYQSQINQFKKKERQFLDVNKQHEKKQFELNKKIAEVEQDNFIQLNKIQKNNNEQFQTIEVQQSTIQQLKTQLQNKINSFQSLQQSFQKLSDNYSDLERQFKLQTMSLDQADRMNLSNQQRYLSLKKTNDQLKKQLQQTHDNYGKKNHKLTLELNELKYKYQQGYKTIKIATGNIQSYKKAVQQLFIIISSEDENFKSDEIYTVPDFQLSKIQIEALGSRAKCLSRLKEINIEQQVEINYLQKENQMKSENLQAKTQELQTTILQYSNKISQIQAKFDLERRQFEEKFHKIEGEVSQLKFQKQKLQNKVKSLGELYEEQKANKNETEQLYQNAQQSIKQLELKLIQSKSRQISLKNQDENLIHNLKVTLNSQIQSHKEKINMVLKQKQTVQKLCADKDKNIQSLKAKITQQDITIQKLEINISKSNEENKSLQFLKMELQENIRQTQTKITNVTQKTQKMAAEIQSLSGLNSQLTNKLRYAHTEISQLSVKNQSLQNKLSSNHTSFSITTEEQKARIITLQENLTQQAKKSNKLFDQLSKTSNNLQMKVFEVKQLESKLQSSQKIMLQLRNENQEKRDHINKLDQTLQSLKRKIFGVEKQKNEYSQEKDLILEELNNRKFEILSLQKEIKELKSDIQMLQNQLKLQQNNYEELNNQKSNLSNLNFQMKEMLGQAKKQIQKANARESQTKSRLSSIQEQLKQKEQYYVLLKNKTQVETQRQIHQLKNKIRKIQAQFRDAEKQWAAQKQELKADLQLYYHDKDQLEIMLEEREQLIEQQEAEILEGQKKIISLNNQLRNILQAWEQQKNASNSSKTQANNIEEGLGRFQNYVHNLQNQINVALSSSQVNAQDEILANSTYPLLELLQTNHKSKARSSFVIQQGKKDEIGKDYDILKEVNQQMLQSHKAART